MEDNHWAIICIGVNKVAMHRIIICKTLNEFWVKFPFGQLLEKVVNKKKKNFLYMILFKFSE